MQATWYDTGWGRGDEDDYCDTSLELIVKLPQKIGHISSFNDSDQCRLPREESKDGVSEMTY
jgi:hypothetical protein